ncbi:MAG: ABC transporter substrate-binding protein [Beutenbergiaceae bacterium]
MRRTIMAVLATASVVALAACGGSDPLDVDPDSASSDAGDQVAAQDIVVGSANFPGNVLLAQIYAAALEADGVDVSTTLNIGSRETYLPALADGSIDVIPEYTGALLTYLNPDATLGSSEQILDALPDAVAEGTQILEPALAQDKDSITVTADTADKYSLTSIADLAPVAGELVLGAAPEFETRPNGIPGLESVYGVGFGEFRPFDAAGNLTVQSLINGQIDAANIYTSDPAIAANDFVVLEDPENLFPAQQIVPLIATAAASETVTDSLNEVSAALTQEALQELMARVLTDGEDPGDVAQDWVSQTLG